MIIWVQKGNIFGFDRIWLCVQPFCSCSIVVYIVVFYPKQKVSICKVLLYHEICPIRFSKICIIEPTEREKVLNCEY